MRLLTDLTQTGLSKRFDLCKGACAYIFLILLYGMTELALQSAVSRKGIITEEILNLSLVRLNNHWMLVCRVIEKLSSTFLGNEDGLGLAILRGIAGDQVKN